MMTDQEADILANQLLYVDQAGMVHNRFGMAIGLYRGPILEDGEITGIRIERVKVETSWDQMKILKQAKGYA